MKKIKDLKKELYNRREVLTAGSALALIGGATALGGGALFKYMWPLVTYGAPAKFLIPIGDLPEPGDEILFTEMKTIVRRQSENEVVAISLVCTHLGCTVNRIETGFLCPCHGSQYDGDGNVVGGPAPSTLPWLEIKKVPGNQIEVNTGEFIPENTYFKFI
jgi:cytochrome b6-f complex iron-sulfur subunit|tara:strand:+ start:288 stop:770 length:483 start_codon:yes stop_codon:yes gene_type:complete